MLWHVICMRAYASLLEEMVSFFSFKACFACRGRCRKAHGSKLALDLVRESNGAAGGDGEAAAGIVVFSRICMLLLLLLVPVVRPRNEDDLLLLGLASEGHSSMPCFFSFSEGCFVKCVGWINSPCRSALFGAYLY